MLNRVLLLALMLLVGCIDPIDFKNSGETKHLVVEGAFTNEANLNYVRLSYSQPFSYPYNQFEEQALVTVVSDEGENIMFAYDKAGYYYPVAGSEAFGKVGSTYTLHIAVGDKAYRSEPVKLKAPIPIDSVHYEFDEQSFAFPGSRAKQLRVGYNVLVDYKDPAGEKNYLRWSFTTEYLFATQPWDFIDPWSGRPAPKDCCAQCFTAEELEQIKVLDDRLTDGRTVISQNILFLPFERYLGVKNKLKIYQYSITGEAYDFYRILEQQKGSTGTVFDPPPAEVKGNVYNVNNDEEQVIGFFDVSGVSVKEVIILRNDIDYPVPIYNFPDDCQVLPGATRYPPPGW